MLDDCQLCGLALAHQRAFGDQRAANAARDGCGDAGVIEIDACGLYGSLANGDIGLGLLLGGLGAHKLLLADGLGLNERLVTLGLCAGLHQVGLGPGQAGLGAGKRRLKGAGVNLKQGLPTAHLAALSK